MEAYLHPMALPYIILTVANIKSAEGWLRVDIGQGLGLMINKFRVRVWWDLGW